MSTYRKNTVKIQQVQSFTTFEQTIMVKFSPLEPRRLILRNVGSAGPSANCSAAERRSGRPLESRFAADEGALTPFFHYGLTSPRSSTIPFHKVNVKLTGNVHLLQRSAVSFMRGRAGVGGRGEKTLTDKTAHDGDNVESSPLN